MPSGFWHGRRVLVTGHTGFKGSWLCLWLQSMGAEVTGLSLSPGSTPNLFQVADVAVGMHSVIGDIRDANTVDEVFSTCQPEVVFHLAAQSLVRYSYTEPVETYATNLMGSLHVLEAMRRTDSVRAAVMVTSDKCYANDGAGRAFVESDPMGGHDPYSNSKACAELLVASHRHSFFVNTHCAVASVRAGNVIGGGDWAEDRLVPDAMRAFAAGEPLRVRNPHSVRPWQHVLEPLAGYLMLAERLHDEGQAFAKAWNFGPSAEDAWPVSRIAECLVAAWGEKAAWQDAHETSVHEAASLKLDATLAERELHWHARWRLPDALDRIVSWHKAHLAGQDMGEYCQSQITDYQHSGHGDA